MARCFETGVAWVVNFLNALGNKKTSKILIQKSKRCLIKLGGFHLRKEKGKAAKVLRVLTGKVKEKLMDWSVRQQMVYGQ